MSVYDRRLSIEGEGPARVPVFQVDNGWHQLSWQVQDCRNAWNCALDVEAWLKIRYAGNGTIEQISGEAGEVGVGYLHNCPVSPEKGAQFAIYHLIGIDHETMQLKFQVQTDLGPLRTKDGERECILQVHDAPLADGSFLVQLSESGYDRKAVRKNQMKPQVWRQNNATGLALRAHFGRYVQRSEITGLATALPVRD